MVSASPTGAEPYDLDGNGHIDSAEFRLHLVERIRLPLNLLDDNDDGFVSSDEVHRLRRLVGGVEQSVEEYLRLYPAGLDVESFADFAGIDPPAPQSEPGWFYRTGVLVRGKLETVSLFDQARPPDAASAATLSFSRDLGEGSAWSTLKGVAMRPFRFDNHPDLVVMPSLSLNQVRYRQEPEARTDTIGLRLSLDRLYRFDGAESIGGLDVRANPAYITDSSGTTRIVSTELQLRPLLSESDETLSPSYAIDVDLQPTLFVEYGRVLRASGDRAVDDGEDMFGRVGPGIDIELSFDVIDEVSVAFAWQYLADVVGGQRDRSLVEIALSLALDREGHFAIQALFVNGDSSAKLENEAYWSLGLGVKY